MAMKLITGTQAKYDALATKNNDALYFITDTLRIYKGANLYSENVKVVDSAPAVAQALPNVLYVTADGTAKVLNAAKTAFITVAEPAQTTIDGTSTANDAKLANIAAIKAFVAAQIASHKTTDLDPITERLEAVEELVGGEGAGSVDSQIKAAMEGAAHDITYDASSLTITIPQYNAEGGDGTPVVINIPKDNFVRSTYYDSATRELVLVVDDEASDSDNATKEVRIPVSQLADVYTGVDVATKKKAITVAVTNDNKVAAELHVGTEDAGDSGIAAPTLGFDSNGYLVLNTSAIRAAIKANADAIAAINTAIGDFTNAKYTQFKNDTTAALEALTNSEKSGRLDTAETEIDALQEVINAKTDTVGATGATTGALATDTAVRSAIDGALTWETI